MYLNFALLLLLNAHNEVLLLHRINTPFGNNCYSLPGGKIEYGETASSAAMREAKNSLGITIEPTDLEFTHAMYRKCNEPEFFACIFKAKSYEGTLENKEPDRHDDMRWFPLDQLPENIVPAHAHAIKQIQQNKMYSEHGWDKDSTTTAEPKPLIVADCIFCQRAHNKDAVCVARFEHCFVIKDAFPVSPGHMLIIPYRHVDNWFSADTTVQQDIMHAVNAIKKMVDAEYHPDGYNIGMNCGPVAGQTVMHLHVHVIPRYKGDMENPRGGVRGVIPAKQKY